MSLKILYLDDEALLCEIFMDTFASEKFHVSTFTDAKLAIASTKSDPPDVIFVDRRLPHTTGDIVALNMPSDIPKYLVSGDNEIKTDYQFTAILKKPFDENEIRLALEHWHALKKSVQLG